MGRVAIFVDGGYLEHVQHALGDPKIAFDRMAAFIAQPDELLRTYYYHCLPYQSPSPTTEEAERFAKKQYLYHGLGEHRAHRDLWDAVDTRTPITGELLRSFA